MRDASRWLLGSEPHGIDGKPVALELNAQRDLKQPTLLGRAQRLSSHRSA